MLLWSHNQAVGDFVRLEAGRLWVIQLVMVYLARDNIQALGNSKSFYTLLAKTYRFGELVSHGTPC